MKTPKHAWKLVYKKLNGGLKSFTELLPYSTTKWTQAPSIDCGLFVFHTRREVREYRRNQVVKCQLKHYPIYKCLVETPAFSPPSSQIWPRGTHWYCRVKLLKKD